MEIDTPTTAPWDRRTPRTDQAVLPRVQRLLDLPFYDQKEQREKWLESRPVLTASDAAAALGKNPHNPRRSLLNRKLGICKHQDDTAATRFGIEHEDEALAYYEQMTGREDETFKFGCVRHPKYPWLGGSPDGVTSDGILVEIKCPYSRPITHSVPDIYFPQIQVLMEVLDLEKTHFVQYRPPVPPFGSPILDVLVVPRNRAWFARRLPEFQAFYDEYTIEAERIEEGRHRAAALIQTAIARRLHPERSWTLQTFVHRTLWIEGLYWLKHHYLQALSKLNERAEKKRKRNDQITLLVEGPGAVAPPVCEFAAADNE